MRVRSPVNAAGKSSAKSGGSRLRRILTLGASVVVLVLIALGYLGTEDGTNEDVGRPSGPPATSVPGELGGLLAQLTVAPERPMTGYSRDEFPHWEDNAPEYGFGPEFDRYERCTTREVMLLRDAVGTVTLDPRTCDLTVGPDGGWLDNYGFVDRKTGQLRPYKWMTKPADVDADHIVALAEAWRSGAAELDESARRRIANDALNLAASDPSANRSKGDQDAANYLPPGDFRCAYVERYLQVKVRYGLTVDPAEQAALASAVGECSHQ